MTGPTPSTGPKPLSGLPSAMAGQEGDIFYLVRNNTDLRITFEDLLSQVADISHIHTIGQIDGLQTQLTSLTSGLGTANTNIGNLSGQLSGKAPTSHTHTIGQVEGLDTALASKAAVNHTHTTAQITGLDTALSGKAPTSHTHTTAQIDGLDTALAARALTVHSHTSAQVTDFSEAVDDRVASLLNFPSGSGLIKSYDDTLNFLNLRVDVDSLTEVGSIVPSNTYLLGQPSGGSIVKFKASLLGGTGGGTSTYVLPAATRTALGGVKVSTDFNITSDGMLTLAVAPGGGTSAGGAIRCITVESFQGKIGAGQTDEIKRANLSAFNDALAYCKANNYGLFVTPGIWEIAGGHIRQDNRPTPINVFGFRSTIRQFSDGESIWEIAGDSGTFVDVALEYQTQQTTGDSVTVAGTLKPDFVITNPGSGYTSAPTVTITPDPRDASGFNATATATIAGGVVTALTLGNAGVRYTYPPLVSISGGGGSGATAVSKVNMPHAALRLLAARYNDIRHIRIRRCWAGILSTTASPSERNSIDQIDIGRAAGRGVVFTGGSGNRWGSVYVHGDGAVFSCEGGVFLGSQGQGSFDLLRIESLACRYPLEITFSDFGTITTLKFTDIRPTFLSEPLKNSVMAFIKSASQGVINTCVISGTDLQGSDTAARPIRCRLFAYNNRSRVIVNDLVVSNTKNKDASTSLVLLGPSGSVASEHRDVGYEFNQVRLDRETATPHLIDRLSDHVPDVPTSFISGLLRFNHGLGGSLGYSAPWGDADFTIYPELHGQVQEITSPLTANRSITVSGRLDAPYVNDTVQSPTLCRGFRQRIVRGLTATGTFSNLVKNDAGTTLATLATPGDWVELFHNGTAWVVWDASIQVTGSPGTVLGFNPSGNAVAVPNHRAMVLPVVGEAATVVAGTGLVGIHMPFPFKVTDVALGANASSTSGAITVDLKVGGTTMFGTKPSIAQGSTWSGVPGKPTLTITDIAAGSFLTLDVTAPGAGAKGLKVYLIGYLT